MTHLLRPPTPPDPARAPPPFFNLDASQPKKDRLGRSMIVVKHEPVAKGCTIHGAGFRPNRKKELEEHRERAARREEEERREMAMRRAQSEGQLPPGSSSGSGRGSGASGRSRREVSQAGSSIWSILGPLSRFDHVANLMQHPLPTRGWDNTMDYERRNNFGALPLPPQHIKVRQSLSQSSYVNDKDYQASCRAQQASEAWRGFPKNNQTEFNEQRVMQAHIMRGAKLHKEE
eukprot:TRINITY_DN115770_c0_g1_i1.p2 TRINITY_DN115770_c0_g1~~TRINITY_DN115770_c0_g1_i1.p2  ORF type:complete len:232 (+),score=64.35 TRINITY_DN115770_c0_g1_i1:107-802(+)